MVEWNAAQQSIIDDAKGKTYEEILKEIPMGEKRWKCMKCFHIVDASPCPLCGDTHVVEMCPLDHCNCHHEIITKIEYCPICGNAICPECGCHDVVQVSRVTGYLADVAGFNNGKKAELKDRKRTAIDDKGRL